MSFSAKVKSEISRLPEKNRCCRISELSAVIRMAGVIELKSRYEIGLRITNENARVIKRVFTLIKQNFNLPVRLIAGKRERLSKNNVYGVVLPASEKTYQMLKTLGIFKDTGEGIHICYGISSKFLKNDCCKRAYIRGAFLGSGSVSDPDKGYHMEFVMFYDELAKDLCRLINSYGLKAKSTDRKGLNLVYIKEGEHITHLLNIMGAHSALLKLENVRIVKDMRNHVNRLVNCETANLNKTVDAALRQAKSIDYINRVIGLSKLPDALREIAAARLNNPGASLKELGLMLNPPLSKSGVNHRLRKLEQIADGLMKKQKNEGKR
jgi:DNA-binding protein WhiA